MNKETAESIKQVYTTAVRAAVAKGNHARWGEAESLSVIEALFDAAVSDDDALAEGFDAIRANVAKVINPSAFAQVLDKLPKDHPSSITRPKKGSGGSRTADDL